RGLRFGDQSDQRLEDHHRALRAPASTDIASGVSRVYHAGKQTAERPKVGEIGLVAQASLTGLFVLSAMTRIWLTAGRRHSGTCWASWHTITPFAPAPSGSRSSDFRSHRRLGDVSRPLRQ